MKTQFLSSLIVFLSLSAQAEIATNPCRKGGGDHLGESQELRLGRYGWTKKCFPGFSELHDESYWFVTYEGIIYIRGYPTFARLIDDKKEVVFAPTDSTASCEGFDDVKIAGNCI